jgi:hypothetical protein
MKRMRELWQGQTQPNPEQIPDLFPHAHPSLAPSSCVLFPAPTPFAGIGRGELAFDQAQVISHKPQTPETKAPPFAGEVRERSDCLASIAADSANGVGGRNLSITRLDLHHHQTSSPATHDHPWASDPTDPTDPLTCPQSSIVNRKSSITRSPGHPPQIPTDPKTHRPIDP